MNKRNFAILAALVLLFIALPAFGVGEGEAAANSAAGWGFLGGGIAIGFAAAFGALGQSKAVAAACSAMARNPGAADNVRFALILGLALIESLVLYALLIAAKSVGLI
jgi:F-type H+-transporting ATPase subunit c